MIWLIAVWVICGAIGAYIFIRKERQRCGYSWESVKRGVYFDALLVFTFGPFSLIVMLLFYMHIFPRG